MLSGNESHGEGLIIIIIIIFISSSSHYDCTVPHARNYSANEIGFSEGFSVVRRKTSGKPSIKPLEVFINLFCWQRTVSRVVGLKYTAHVRLVETTGLLD